MLPQGSALHTESLHLRDPHLGPQHVLLPEDSLRLSCTGPPASSPSWGPWPLLKPILSSYFLSVIHRAAEMLPPGQNLYRRRPVPVFLSLNMGRPLPGSLNPMAARQVLLFDHKEDTGVGPRGHWAGREWWGCPESQMSQGHAFL